MTWRQDEEKMKNMTKRGLGDEKMMKWWKDDTHTQLNLDNDLSHKPNGR